MMDAKHAQDILTLYATRRLDHLWADTCPDEVSGFDSRDPECVVCLALMALDGSVEVHERPRDGVLYR